MSKKERKTFYPKEKQHWRAWLDEYHAREESIWLVCYKKNSAKHNIEWGEAVDEALCFGWIDSTRVSVDEEHFLQYFTKRKAKSNWSKINKQKVAHLIEKGLMTEAGFLSIRTAKSNGSWESSTEIENLIVPEELAKELEKNTVANTFFNGLSNSVKKSILMWIAQAKKNETRTKRIQEIIQSGNEQKKPSPFRV